MSKIEVFYNGNYKSFELPDCWEDCSPTMYNDICKFLFKGNYTTGAMRRYLIKSIGIPKTVVDRISQSEVNAIWRVMNFVTEAPEHATSKSKPWLLIFAGPRAGFQNVTTEQFAHADDALNAYNEAIKQGDAAKELRAFCAQMITPFGIRYRPRIADAIEKILKLASKDRQMIWLYEYLGIRMFYKNTFKLSFSANGESDGYGWPGMFVDLAGEKFGTANDVKKASVYEVFYSIEMSLKAASKKK